LKDRQEKLKERKLNQNGSKTMTKHLYRLKDTYLNFNYEGLMSLEIMKARRIKFHKYLKQFSIYLESSLEFEK